MKYAKTLQAALIARLGDKVEFMPGWDKQRRVPWQPNGVPVALMVIQLLPLLMVLPLVRVLLPRGLGWFSSWFPFRKPFGLLFHYITGSIWSLIWLRTTPKR
jgi:hypothetical protein